MLGAASRTFAVQYNWLCMAAATFLLIAGTIDERFYRGGALYLFVNWSWFAIEWVDQHSRWEDVLPPQHESTPD